MLTMPNKKDHEVKLQRLDSLSCAPGPDGSALGMESKDIPPDSITASSTADDSSPYNARLNCKRGAWCPKLSSQDPYLQIDLGSVYDVTGVATQGVGNTASDRFVKTYKVQYSRNGKEWEFHQEGEDHCQEFEGNNDSSSIVRKNVKKAMRTRFVRFYPVNWYGKPCMRVEVYGVQVGRATYETSVNISDMHGNSAKGGPILQLSIQLFGENGYTRKLPLELEASEKDQLADALVFKRKIFAADVGWVKHLKLSYDHGQTANDDTRRRRSMVRTLRRMSSSLSDTQSNGESGFFIDEIGIDVKETGQHFTFPCKQWLLQGPTAFDPSHRRKSRLTSVDSHLVTDEDFDHILSQEDEDTEDWHKRKTPLGIESWRRKATEMETTQLTKTTFNFEGIPYNDAVRLITDWNLRVKWDRTFKTAIIVEEDIDSSVIYCCLKMPPLFRTWDILFSVMNRAYSSPEPHHVVVWCSTEHSSVSEADRSILSRVQVRLSGLVIRPVGDGSESCKGTLLTRMRVHEGIPRPVKNTYLNSRPAQWVKDLQAYCSENAVLKPIENDKDDVFLVT